MLVEFECDQFKYGDGSPRGMIRCYEDLNVVLGTGAHDTSIGKTGLLKVIDFIYGGEAFKQSDSIEFVGDQVIKYALKFNGHIYKFVRTTYEKNRVIVCDDGYNPVNSLTEKEYREKLISYSNLDKLDATFRMIVGRFSRIPDAKKLSVAPSKPLHTIGSEKAVQVITAFEKSIWYLS